MLATYWQIDMTDWGGEKRGSAAKQSPSRLEVALDVVMEKWGFTTPGQPGDTQPGDKDWDQFIEDLFDVLSPWRSLK